MAGLFHPSLNPLDYRPTLLGELPSPLFRECSAVVQVSSPMTWLPPLAYMTTFGLELAIDSNMANVYLTQNVQILLKLKLDTTRQYCKPALYLHL